MREIMTTMIATKKRNEKQNGIEIYFNVYPIQGTKDTLKNNGFRWNHKKMCWYALYNFATDSIASAICDTSIKDYERIAARAGELVKKIEKATTKTSAPKATKPEKINLDNLGENTPKLHGAELAKAIREDLKRRGVKGVTVRAERSGWTSSITVTVKATAADFVSIEEAKERYSFGKFGCNVDRGFYNGDEWIYNFYELSNDEQRAEYEKYIRYNMPRVDVNRHYLEDCRGDYWNITTPFFEKLCAIFKIANQWNYDNSDPMTDYFDVGYYLDIDVKTPEDFTPAEKMTAEARKAYDEEKRQEEEKRAAELAKFEAEEKERKKAYEEAEKKRKADLETIKNDVNVIDLEEPDYIYITELVGGIGKECTLDELRESEAENHRREDALITRKVIFHSEEAFEAFGRNLLCDFDFLQGKGGTASEDIRLEEVAHIYDLNTDQNDTVKWFLNNCVAIYLGEELRLVSDPEGYSYSRYTFELSDASEIRKATPELEKQRKDSESKAPLYFPEPVEVQADAIKPGDEITVYAADGWLLNVQTGRGIVTDVKPGTYAQYTGVYISMREAGKRKDTTIFLHDGKKSLIYSGIKPRLPESITQRPISNMMYEVLQSDEVFKNILDYYKDKPILDTIQR